MIIVRASHASEIAIGAALLQEDCAVEYFSRKFSPVEQRYSTHEREALAMLQAMWRFRLILIGHHFIIYSEHKPLLRWVNNPPVNERHARWQFKIQDMK